MAVKNAPKAKAAPSKEPAPDKGSAPDNTTESREPTEDTKRAVAEFHASQGIRYADADEMFAKNGIKIGKKKGR